MQGQITTTYSSYRAITPSDSVPNICQAIYVGGAGNIALKPLEGGTAVTFTAVPVGTILPVNCYYLMATNTTATLLIGLN